MNYKLQIFIFLLALNLSCSNNKQKSKDVKTIELKKTDEIQPISVFISDVDYIELKSGDKNLVIGEIEGLKILDNEIIVKNRFSQENNLLRFSADGAFLNEIGKTGRGPGEISHPRDIILYDGGYAVWEQSGIYTFSKSGEYKNRLFDAHLQGNRFFISGNNFYLFHETTAPGLLSEYSEKGNLQRVVHPYNHQFAGFDYAGVTEMASDSFHLFSPINDTIFAFSRNKLVPQYIIYGESHPTFIQLLKKAGSKEPVEMLRFINKNQSWVINRFLENRNFIFIDYRLGSNSYRAIIRKSDWQISYVKTLINDIDGGVWDTPLYLSDDDELYIPLNSYQISGHKIKNKKRHDFEEVQKKTELNDNPVIMRCKLKS